MVNRHQSNVLNTTEHGLTFLADIGAPNAAWRFVLEQLAAATA